ncbi:hypothetical protein JRO89_XS11G0103300 [Xanthoceras sorbifolium]|uniref:Pentatricopeptide repeat-containing protein n=1 Tax=Xanthoceras sorbifolium TaxID=99658 RepID=A0ABQ8HFD5_9ROSI|nr:hypothetical protein JRO89_XS11G0103300 [Xanthoceras sorbifolium]
MDDAQRVFDDMLGRNTITWTSLMKVYSEIGDIETPFQIACETHRKEEKLQVCNLLEDGILRGQIHGFTEKVFNGFGCKAVQCLNSMILEYFMAACQVLVFVYLISSGLELTHYTFTNIISMCIDNVGVEEGKQLHGLAVKFGFVREISIGNAIVTLYGKYGMVEEAKRMFSAMSRNGLTCFVELLGLVMSDRNHVSWNATLSAYALHGQGKTALLLFEEMKEGLAPDGITILALLQACTYSSFFF